MTLRWARLGASGSIARLLLVLLVAPLAVLAFGGSSAAATPVGDVRGAGIPTGIPTPCDIPGASAVCDKVGDVGGAIGGAVGDAVGDVAGNAFEGLVTALGNGTRTAMAEVSSVWMKVPSPEVATVSGNSATGNAAITSLQNDLMPITAAFAMIAFALAIGRIAMNPERAGDGARGIGRQLVTVVLATLPALAVTAVMIQAGDDFSPWIIDRAAGGDASSGFNKLLAVSVTPGNAGVFLIIFFLALLGSIAQVMFMVLRGAALIALFVLLPTIAAGSATEEGWIRLKKAGMLIVGFALYKPVAAIIYATGLKLTSDDGAGGSELWSAIYGMTVIIMAALALPAFIKFVMPAAAAGSSSAFSGASMVGAVAAGAAVMALPAGAAAASGASGASGGGGSGGMAKGASSAAGLGGGSGSEPGGQAPPSTAAGAPPGGGSPGSGLDSTSPTGGGGGGGSESPTSTGDETSPGGGSPTAAPSPAPSAAPAPAPAAASGARSAGPDRSPSSAPGPRVAEAARGGAHLVQSMGEEASSSPEGATS